MKWEVFDKDMSSLVRTRVPWGWLVMNTDDVVHDTPHNGMQSGWDFRTSLTFIFDPFHRWKGDKKVK